MRDREVESDTRAGANAPFAGSPAESTRRSPRASKKDVAAEPLASDAVDIRIIAAMRLVLATSALLIIVLDPSEPDRLVHVTYGALIVYTLYSGAVYVAARRRAELAGYIRLWSHWVDVGWYVLLIALSSGTSSIFFFFFFFSILVASFIWGFSEGLKVTLVSAGLFTMIGYATTPQDVDIHLNRLLLRPIYLTVIGYLMAYWGGREMTLKRRLGFLKEVTVISNPRFGVDRTLQVVLHRLRDFFDADRGMFVSSTAGSERLYISDGGDLGGADVIRPLLALPPDAVVLFAEKKDGSARVQVFDESNQDECEREIMTIAGLLDAASLLTVPVKLHGKTRGRVYLTAERRGAFDRSDADFVAHLFEHVMPHLENIRLVDKLATSAAEQERQRIAHDLHDSVIQPYIGLQMGLAAIRTKLAADDQHIHEDVENLIELTNSGLNDLRGYARQLRRDIYREGGLIPAIRRFATRFEDATGITVAVEAGPIEVNDRLAAEVFQIVAEGLSNIKRHTQSTHADVAVECSETELSVRIENASSPNGPEGFRPKSISDRAGALGGWARVEQSNGRVAVHVCIPL